MKKIAATALTFFLLTAFAGCGGKSSDSDSENVISAPESPLQSSDESGISAEESSEPDAPTGEPTFFIGLDGKAVLTSEITWLDNTDKNAETLTKDDLGAVAFCDGFTYVKEPSGIAFNSYSDPEKFDGTDFLGDEAENTNEWKRVYVGDEICGLKVRSASAVFDVEDYEDARDFPGRYLSIYNVGSCELDGTIEIEGFLQVLPDSMYPETSQLVEFFPCESKLPIMPGIPDSEKGYTTPVSRQVYGGFGIFGEHGCMGFGHLSNITCDMDGIGRGDIAYARVTLGNIRCAGGSISATLEKVERISEILIHNEDER